MARPLHLPIRTSNRTMSGRPGYTAVELVVTVAIMGILATLSVPAFAGFRSGLELRNSAQEVANAVRNAQALSIASQHGAAHTVTIDQATRRYTVSWMNGGTQVIDATGTLKAGLQFTASSTFTFDRLTGRLSTGMTPIVISSGGQTATVSVDASGAIIIS